MKSIFQTTLAIALSLSFFACGSSTNAPMDILTSNTIPALSSINAANTYSALVSGFSASSPYWTFQNSGFAGGNYLAPADGLVGRVDLATINGLTVTYVTLIHSAIISTRVFGMQQVFVRPGDTVSRGSIIGSFNSSGAVAFQVLEQGAAVCPLSFVNSAFRTTLAQTTYYLQLCN